MGTFRRIFWTLPALPVFWLLYLSYLDSLATLSPQGCRMSWMSPSYVVQGEFDTSWTPLSRRYSLLLYREVGWDNEQPSGRPALFIPGNAGSSHQVRSIASSASRQIYTTPHVRSPDISADVEPLDLYAVEFNEDLSALHGPTLQTQTKYVQSALEYIASKYAHKPNLQITLLGHSMGGIVVLNAIASSQHRALVNAVITMSSPHSLPPARLDREIEQVFDSSIDVLWHTQTLNQSNEYTPPVLALCGGATDNMLPMESCMLPSPPPDAGPSSPDLYRRTVFTSGLDGTWTGVGHREMVWCHQVRWRVARASLELAVAKPSARGAILDRWFTGVPDPSALRSTIPPSNLPPIKVSNGQLTRRTLPPGITTFQFPITPTPVRLIVMLSSGRIQGVSPEKGVLTDVVVDLCESNEGSEPTCKPASANSVRLVPNPSLRGLFPVPGEGIDESDGVVIWEGEVVDAHSGYFSVAVRSASGSPSWLVARLESVEAESTITLPMGKIAPFFGSTEVLLPTSQDLVNRVWFPNLISNAMIAYRVAFTHKGDCKDPFLTPILVHTSSDAESHFHRTLPPNNPVLHTHNSGPFLGTKHGVNLTIYNSGECHVTSMRLHVDWRISAGRAASRLWSGVFAWAVATVAAMNALAWFKWKEPHPFFAPLESFEYLTRQFATPALVGVTVLSILPLPKFFILGLSGEPIFSILAPFCLGLAVMTVGCSCYLLDTLQWIISKLYLTLRAIRLATDVDNRPPPFTRSFLAFHVFVAALVAVFIPYQVAYLVAFLLHLGDCSISRTYVGRQGLGKAAGFYSLSSYSQASHLLLLLFWMLPLVAPVLIVWARTLINAGLTTPFDGDHNILKVVFIVMSVELSGSPLPEASSRLYQNVIGASYLALGTIAIILGARYTYTLYFLFNVCCACFVIGTVGSYRYLRRVSD